MFSKNLVIMLVFFNLLPCYADDFFIPNSAFPTSNKPLNAVQNKQNATSINPVSPMTRNFNFSCEDGMVKVTSALYLINATVKNFDSQKKEIKATLRAGEEVLITLSPLNNGTKVQIFSTKPLSPTKVASIFDAIGKVK